MCILKPSSSSSTVVSLLLMICATSAVADDLIKHEVEYIGQELYDDKQDDELQQHSPKRIIR